MPNQVLLLLMIDSMHAHMPSSDLRNETNANLPEWHENRGIHSSPDHTQIMTQIVTQILKSRPGDPDAQMHKSHHPNHPPNSISNLNTLQVTMVTVFVIKIFVATVNARQINPNKCGIWMIRGNMDDLGGIWVYHECS